MLKKTNRLTKTSSVKATLKLGRGFFNPNFQVRFVPNPGSPPRFTVVVSTKVSKKAVIRNRLKRQARELLRLELAKFSFGDYVIMLKPGAIKLMESRVLSQTLLQEFKKWKLVKGSVAE